MPSSDTPKAFDTSVLPVSSSQRSVERFHLKACWAPPLSVK